MEKHQQGRANGPIEFAGRVNEALASTRLALVDTLGLAAVSIGIFIAAQLAQHLGCN